MVFNIVSDCKEVIQFIINIPKMNKRLILTKKYTRMTNYLHEL